MKSLVKFLSLPAFERHLFLRAVFIVVYVRFALRFFSFGKVQEAASRPGRRRRSPKHPRPYSLDQIIRTVERAVRRISGKDTCLVRAITAEILCSEEGYPVCFRVGVSKDKQGSFKAHAWVESEGRVVLGKQKDLCYQPILTVGNPG